MAKTDGLQGSLDLLILKLLSRRAPLHGYALMTGIIESSGDVLRVEEGSIYPALHRLEEQGWIQAQWVTKDNGRRSRVYELSELGRRQLPVAEERWTAISTAIRLVLEGA